LKNIAWILAASLLLVATAFASGSSTSSNGRKLYKWVDEQGVTHYGDQIPPEYATQERQVINSQGIELDHLEAQKSPEQLAEEDKRKQEAQQRAHSDKKLLSTYSSVQDIQRLRDQRLNHLSDQIKVTTQFLESLNGKMTKLRSASMGYKPYSGDANAPPMPDQMAEDLVRVGNDIRTQEENLREKRAEAASMSQQFDSDIARYRELKGTH